MQIEDLGTFLSEQMHADDSESWKGFSLGYSDEDKSPITELNNQTQELSLLTSNLPTYSPFQFGTNPIDDASLQKNAKFKLYDTLMEFNDFSLEDKHAPRIPLIKNGECKSIQKYTTSNANQIVIQSASEIGPLYQPPQSG